MYMCTPVFIECYVNVSSDMMSPQMSVPPLGTLLVALLQRPRRARPRLPVSRDVCRQEELCPPMP